VTQISRPVLILGLSTAALLLGAAGVVSDLASLAMANDTVSHTIAVPAVVAVLLYWNRQAILASGGTSRLGMLAGVVLVVAGLGLATATHAAQSSYDALMLDVFGVVVAWYGLFVACLGGGAVRAALFPLAFLLLAVPIPTVVLDGATRFLKDGSTEAVAGLFSLTGTPFLREGYVFHLPGTAIEVADECSGIRSSIGLLLTSLLAGHMYLRRGWSMVALVATVLPVVILKNGVRIVVLSILAIRVDPGYLTGQLHHEGGVLIFLLALVLLAPVLMVLRRVETPTVPIPMAQRT